MDKKNVWLLYDRKDLSVNRDFVALMKERGAQRGMRIEPVTMDAITLTMDENGTPAALLRGKPERPDAILARMRLPLFSRHLEAMGVPVFNGSRVCEICNDKRRTLQFLSGLPMPATAFVAAGSQPPESYPVVVKPACSHGGDRVTLVNNREQWQEAMSAILPEAVLQQRVVGKPGLDLRVYVVFGQIVAAVLRTAKTGIVSNYKLGGSVSLHTLKREEQQLVTEALRRFNAADAPLCFAGIDLMYESYGPVIGEVEDVVGSRMLYQTSQIDIVSLFLDGLMTRI